jgi:DNA-binding LacI/PurR family transcriptional regulator
VIESKAGATVHPRPRGATIRDVAQAAGVSHQTVSRVLNQHPSLRAETRERVLQAMNALQFRPNRAARSLVTSRSGVIGVLVSHGAEYGVASKVHAVEAAARNAGYLVDVANIASIDARSITTALDRLVDHDVEGLVVLAPQARVLEVIADLALDLPFVTTHSADRLDDHKLSVDQTAGARMATRHLLELGHRVIRHIAGPPGWIETDERARGFRAELAEWGLTAPVALNGDWTAESGYRIGRTLLAQDVFTAVFSSNDQMALGFGHACRVAGLDVPADMSVVGFDDIPEAKHYWPPLTTVRQDFPELGRRCVELLVGTLRNCEAEYQGNVVPELVVRGSTAAPLA